MCSNQKLAILLLGSRGLRGRRGERRRPQSGEMWTWLFFVSGEDFAEAAHSVHESQAEPQRLRVASVLGQPQPGVPACGSHILALYPTMIHCALPSDPRLPRQRAGACHLMYGGGRCGWQPCAMHQVRSARLRAVITCKLTGTPL